MVVKRVHNVAFNNAERCRIVMLHSFGQGQYWSGIDMQDDEVKKKQTSQTKLNKIVLLDTS